MSHPLEVRVPDIGDFKDIPVIEVLVKPGDVIKPEDSLVTLESDKATMDVPAPVAGTVLEIKVKPGDKVSQGSLILILDAVAAAAGVVVAAPPAAAAASPAPTAPPPAVPVAARPQPTGPAIAADLHAEVVVLGSGPGGYTAAFRAADLGKQVVMIER